MAFDAVSQTVAAFGAFMPTNVVAMRHYDPDDDSKQTDVRIGMVLAVTWSFVFAAYIANKENSGKAYVYWMAAVALMITLYEASFRSKPNG